MKGINLQRWCAKEVCDSRSLAVLSSMEIVERMECDGVSVAPFAGGS